MSLYTNTNPFVGLRPFESDESLLFFGRQEQTVELLQRLHAHHFVAVIGNSGSGKSSLIRAGLIPRLKAGYLLDGQDRWMIATMKPGQSPLHNLAEAVLNQLKSQVDPGDISELVKNINEEGDNVLLEMLKPLWEEQQINFLLLIDQFEELFRFMMNQKEVEKKDEATDFVNIMLAVARQVDLPVYVVMTMRSDFIGDCAQFYGLPEAMNQSQYLIPRLNRGNLRNAIVGPAKLFGNIVEPALITRLLNDAVSLRDELPLLQHALMRIWDQEMIVDKNGKLDLDDYEKIGGIEKALSVHADEALEGMSEDELTLTKKIFQSLTMIDENGRKIRRPLLMSELMALTGEGREKLMGIIDRFSEEKKSFLIVSKVGHTSEEVIDISHESLIRQWTKLAAWSDEEATSAKIYLHLKESAELYKEKKKDFLEGSELQIAMEWYKTFDPSPVWAKRYNEAFEESIEYLRESGKHQKLSERKNKRVKRNRVILIFASVIFLLTAVAFYVLKQRFQAIKDAFVLNSVSQEQAIEDPTVGLRIGEAAYEKYQDSTIRTVSEKIYRDNAFYKTIIRDSVDSRSFAIADTFILTSSTGNHAKLWSIHGQLITEFIGHHGAVWAVAFSPDNEDGERKVLTGSLDSTAILWDLKGNKLRDFGGHQGEVKAVAFSPDGKSVLTGGQDGTAILWNLNDTAKRIFKQHHRVIRSLAFSSDGKKIVTGSEDSTAIIWKTDGSIIRILKGHRNTVGTVCFSSDGKEVLTGSHDYKAILWDINGTIIREFTGHTRGVISVEFSPGDESRILTGSYDGTARLWSLHDGTVLKEFKKSKNSLWKASFLPDGSRIVTTDDEKTVRLWTLGNGSSREFSGHTDSVVSVVFSPDGNRILTGSFDNTARLWSLDNNDTTVVEFKSSYGKIKAVAFSPNGSKIIICSGNTPELINLKDNSRSRLTGHTGSVNSVCFSPKGEMILTGSSDGTARLWWYSSGALINSIKGDGSSILKISFLPDGKKFFIATANGTIQVCNPDGSKDKQWTIEQNKVSLTSIAFSPDGTKMACGYRDGHLKLFNIGGDDDDEPVTIKAHDHAIYGLSFSPNGERILSGSEDYSVKLWNLEGVCLSILTGHMDCVFSVAFSPDGKKMVSCSEDKSARLWTDMPLEDFLKSDLIDPLTQEQKKTFGIK